MSGARERGLVELVRRALVTLLVAPIRLYKLVLSPFLPRVCRFHPSCSVYAMGALRVHGPLKGGWLAVRRLSRCHPFNPGGLDPVPPRDGHSAVELLDAVDPFVASRLAEPPPPWLPVGDAHVEGPHSAERTPQGAHLQASPSGLTPLKGP